MEYCLEKDAADYIRRMETMSTAWTVLDTFYNRLLLFRGGLDGRV